MITAHVSLQHEHAMTTGWVQIGSVELILHYVTYMMQQGWQLGNSAAIPAEPVHASNSAVTTSYTRVHAHYTLYYTQLSLWIH